MYWPYLFSIQPPKYPKKIDEPLAEKGRVIFENICSECHGTYGSKEEYPNLLIPESIVGTDSLLNQSNYQYSDMIDLVQSQLVQQRGSSG
jgi:mono/diheme cytochrome c family protein